MTLADEARNGWVYLVGTGPGRRDQITVRALELIKTASVIVHDEGVSETILSLANKRASLVAAHASDEHAHRQLYEHVEANRSVLWLRQPRFEANTQTGAILGRLDRDSIPFEVVDGLPELCSPAAPNARPLRGKRVLLLRPAHQVGPTARMLKRRGAEVLSFPAIEIGPAPDVVAVKKAIANLPTYDLLAFTSENGVRCFWNHLTEAGCDARALGGAAIAAIGPATASFLLEHGIRADIVAESFVAESLAEAIVSHAKTMGKPDARLLLPRALVAREVLPQSLTEAGMVVDVVPVYETRYASPDQSPQLRDALNASDVVMFTSSSTVTSCLDLMQPDGPSALSDIVVASIGPITSNTLRTRGVEPDITASVSTTPGLTDAVESWLSRQTGPATSGEKNSE